MAERSPPLSPDALVTVDDWSDLGDARPDIDEGRMLGYRAGRLRDELVRAEVAMCMLVSPVSLRYALDYRSYALFQMHIPTTYAFVAIDGPTVLHGVYGPTGTWDLVRPPRALAYFDGGDGLAAESALLASDIAHYLDEIGDVTRRVAVEYVNPSLTRALLDIGIDVVDGTPLVERARLVKSPDEIDCMRWSITVAEAGIAKVEGAVSPGVSEVQLWALLNYVNLANEGEWHDGRMLASGDRINPWLQEASRRRLVAGDLVGLDTDMVGPFGYCADISRTFHCGPDRPTRRQRELYQVAAAEIAHNRSLLGPGVTFADFQRRAMVTDERYHAHSYTCALHGVGLCDEYPRINAVHRGPVPPHTGETATERFVPGMVVCVESFVGAVGERDGVKLEEMVLITADGSEQLSTYPLDDALMG